jgi:hypothetical protein
MLPIAFFLLLKCLPSNNKPIINSLTTHTLSHNTQKGNFNEGCQWFNKWYGDGSVGHGGASTSQGSFSRHRIFPGTCAKLDLDSASRKFASCVKGVALGVASTRCLPQCIWSQVCVRACVCVWRSLFSYCFILMLLHMLYILYKCFNN